MRLLLISFSFLIFSTSCLAEKLIIEPEMGREPILSAINNAKSSVDIVMYGFTDENLMHPLIQTQKTGKNVDILLEKLPYKNEDENTIAAKTLRSGKVHLQWANPDFKLTHQKTLIIDKNTAVVMTFNFTHSSFSKERNFALIIDDPAMVNEIESVFHADWKRHSITPKNPNLVWSPDNSREKLLHFIESAKSTIEIYAQDITDYKTIGALAKAAHRGINIDILTSSKPTNKNQKKYSYLTRSGIHIHYSTTYYIHAKVIIIDHQHAMLGSMNLTKPSIDDNRELSVITHNTEIIQALEKTFAYDSGKKPSSAFKMRWWLETINRSLHLFNLIQKNNRWWT